MKCGALDQLQRLLGRFENHATVIPLP